MHKRLFVEVADDINGWIQGIVNTSKVFSTKIYGNGYPEFYVFKKDDCWMNVFYINELWKIFRKISTSTN